MNFGLIGIYILFSIGFVLIGIIIGTLIKASKEKYTSDTLGKEGTDAGSIGDEFKIQEEIKPQDPFPLTTALDQKNDLDIKRSIRDSNTQQLFLLPTGGLHNSKIRAKNSWLRN
jgi:hypothetical protein